MREQFDVGGGQVGHGDLQVEIRVGAADGGPGAQADHAHPAGELGLQPGHAQAGIGGGVVVAVLVVHVEDQHRGAVVVHQPGQHDAGQEGFAGAGRAEDARPSAGRTCPG